MHSTLSRRPRTSRLLPTNHRPEAIRFLSGSGGAGPLAGGSATTLAGGGGREQQQEPLHGGPLVRRPSRYLRKRPRSGIRPPRARPQRGPAMAAIAARACVVCTADRFPAKKVPKKVRDNLRVSKAKRVSLATPNRGLARVAKALIVSPRSRHNERTGDRAPARRHGERCATPRRTHMTRLTPWAHCTTRHRRAHLDRPCPRRIDICFSAATEGPCSWRDALATCAHGVDIKKRPLAHSVTSGPDLLTSERLCDDFLPCSAS
jgi:hypothetical protein